MQRAVSEGAETEAVSLLSWNSNNFWVSDDSEAMVFLLEKYGRHVESERFTDFTVHTFSGVSRGGAWSFYDRLDDLDVRYDGGIALTGFALGQGKEQLRMERDCLNCSSGVAWDGGRQ